MSAAVGVREKGGLVVSLVTRLLFLRPGDRRVRADRRPGGRPARHALQRRQARPAGPLLVGHGLRGSAAQDRIRRRPLPARPRPLLPPDGRGHRLLERPRLQPRQPHHVFRRQPGRLRLGVGFRPGDAATSTTAASSSTSATTGGCADGATVDAEGCYWTTLPESGKLSRYDPDGRLMRTIMMPTSIPTCCEFGGKDLDILYVTSAQAAQAHRPASRRPLRHRRRRQGPAAAALQGMSRFLPAKRGRGTMRSMVEGATTGGAGAALHRHRKRGRITSAPARRGGRAADDEPRLVGEDDVGDRLAGDGAGAACAPRPRPCASPACRPW